MRDHDGVDRFRVDAGGGEIGRERAGRRCHLPAGAGVEQDELRAGIDQQCRERRRQLLGRHERIVHRLADLGVIRIADEFLVDRAVPHAVIERGDLEGADLVTVEAGRLLAGRRRCGLRA